MELNKDGKVPAQVQSNGNLIIQDSNKNLNVINKKGPAGMISEEGGSYGI